MGIGTSDSLLSTTEEIKMETSFGVNKTSK